MAFFKKSKIKELRELSINSTLYKVNIITENRKNSRVSITKTGINIRLTKYLTEIQRKEQIRSFLSWAENTIIKKNISFPNKYREFKNGDTLKIYDKTIVLEILESKKQSVSGKINQEKLTASLPNNLKNEERQKYMSKIVSRLLAKNYKTKISAKLHAFNKTYNFGEINQIRLKNNSTNWGSCSSKNNINVSIRLLLAPEYVVDYVLIHELCHLQHRNHSQNFWNLVEHCCPAYKEAEHWLKKNSSLCII